VGKYSLDSQGKYVKDPMDNEEVGAVIEEVVEEAYE
jgi:hypothetical protein